MESITAPGSLKAYAEAHAEYGVLPWAEVVQPAIDYAERHLGIDQWVDGMRQAIDAGRRKAASGS